MCTYHPKSPERICHLEKKKNENKVSLFSSGWAHKDGATIQAFYKVSKVKRHLSLLLRRSENSVLSKNSIPHTLHCVEKLEFILWNLTEVYTYKLSKRMCFVFNWKIFRENNLQVYLKRKKFWFHVIFGS